MRGKIDTDVLVIGSGLAGISAAIQVAKSALKVVMVSSANIFSGSSFYPGTWGLGLVGPQDREDTEDFIQSIRKRGKGVAIDSMVRRMVENINETVEEFESLGIKLSKPSKGTEKEKEYIPCFDEKVRRWRGWTKKDVPSVLGEVFKELDIEMIPFFEALELIYVKNKVLGAIGVREEKELLEIRAKATILATGGLSGLYERYLTTDDVKGTGLGMALKVGAKGINLEFMQIMLAFVYPRKKIIYNEKTFLASEFYNEKEEIFLEKYLPRGLALEDVLRERGKHGPFSTEDIGRYVDLGIYEEIKEQDKKSVGLHYRQDRLNAGADFVKVYFDWLEREKKIKSTDKIEIAPFMHASNGGIYINEKGETGVLGLYAAGEVTGGMHGADRMGGLATVNALVFGKLAGKSAGQYVKDFNINGKEEEYQLVPLYIDRAKEKLETVKRWMQEDAFLIREEEGLDRLLEKLPQLLLDRKDQGSVKERGLSYRLYNSILSAMAVVSMQKARKESRGSHYRKDYTSAHPQLGLPFLVSLKKVGEYVSKEDFLVRAFKEGDI